MSGISRNIIFCLAFLLLTANYLPLANGQASMSGLFAQSRSLANLIGYGIKNDTRTWAEVLRILERTDVSKEMGDGFQKLVGKSMTEGAATLPEHLERIEVAVRNLEPEINKVVARLNGEERPNLSVDDLANKKSRCNTIEVLRDEQRQMSEDVEALKGLSALLDKAEDRLDILDDLSMEMAKGYEEMYDELTFRMESGNISVIPELMAIGMFSSELEKIIVQLTFYNPDQNRTINNVITRLRRELKSVPKNIDQLKSNFDYNMNSIIDPLSADSCDDDQLDKDDDDIEAAISEAGDKTISDARNSWGASSASIDSNRARTASRVFESESDEIMRNMQKRYLDNSLLQMKRLAKSTNPGSADQAKCPGPAAALEKKIKQLDQKSRGPNVGACVAAKLGREALLAQANYFRSCPAEDPDGANYKETQRLASEAGKTVGDVCQN